MKSTTFSDREIVGYVYLCERAAGEECCVWRDETSGAQF